MTSCSVAMGRKSMYMISATGLRPIIAAPMAAPTIAISEMGVSLTLSGPNSSRRPLVTLKAPPYAPMSSPIRTTLSSLCISCLRPSLMASA